MIATRPALLLALRQGPGYGRDLVRRIRVATRERSSPAEGSIYPALRALERARLLRSWIVVPGGRKGARARRYYELTLRGVVAAESAANALASLLGLHARSRVRRPEPGGLRERLELAAELSEEVLALRLRPAGSVKRRGGAA